MKKHQGFTLIEVLIYLALFGILFSGLFVCAFTIIENIGRNDTQIMVLEEGDFLLAKIELEANPAAIKENNGFLEINGIPLNNSNTRISGVKFATSSDGGPVTASFTLVAKTSAGKIYSHDFSSTYSLHQ